MNIFGLRSNFFEGKTFSLNQTFLTFLLYVKETRMTLAIFLWGFIFPQSERILLLMCMVLQLMWRKEFLLHRTYLWKTLRILTYAFGWLYFTQCLTSVSSINHLLCLLCTVFGSISSKIDEILSINSSDNAFVLGDFNDYDKDWLTYSGKTDRLVNLALIFLSQMTLLR